MLLIIVNEYVGHVPTPFTTWHLNLHLFTQAVLYHVTPSERADWLWGFTMKDTYYHMSLYPVYICPWHSLPGRQSLYALLISWGTREGGKWGETNRDRQIETEINREREKNRDRERTTKQLGHKKVERDGDSETERDTQTETDGERTTKQLGHEEVERDGDRETDRYRDRDR